MNEDLIKKLISAWTVPGKNPAYHEQQKAHLKEKWPMLYQAIEAILKAKREE